MNYHNLYSEELHGSSYGGYGLKITVAATLPVNLSDPSIQNAAYKAAAVIQDAVLTAALAADPAAQQRKTAEREQLLGLFPSPVFVTEIPNGYCPQFCCKHLPWYRVTTSVGVFEIGWRKRVINIDWTAVPNAKTAKELFAGEEVTKGSHYIHAWSTEDARRYIAVVMTSVTR